MNNTIRSIYETSDGKDFVDQMKDTLNRHTVGLYSCNPDSSEWAKGYCKALYDLIKLFETSTENKNEVSNEVSWA